MKHESSRIPDDMVTEVLTEATRLQSEANRGYSHEELAQVCSESGISADLFQAAVRTVKEKRRRQAEKRQQLRQWVIQQAKRGVSVGMSLLIPAIALSSLFIFRSQLEQLIDTVSDRLAPQPSYRYFGEIDRDDELRSEPKASPAPQVTPEPAPTVIPAAAPEPAASSEPEREPKASSAPKVTPEPEPTVARKPKAPPAPTVVSEPAGLREVFRRKVVGKTPQDVMQSVGEPTRTSESAHSNAIHWNYKNVKDPESGELREITVIFEDGAVDGVFFHR